MIELSERLRDWADVHEKSLAFHDPSDESMLEEVEAEVVLLREAAGELDRLRTGLDRLAHPNRAVRATAQDARDMAAFAADLLKGASS